MGKAVTFLHTADVHLGAPIRGLHQLTSEWTARLSRAIPEAFDRVIDTALSRAVDFVVLAGDAFDTSRASYADQAHFFDALNKLDAAGIPMYLVAGNHDPYTTWMRDVEKLPDSAHLLGVEGPECALYRRDGEPLCAIVGRSYYNQTWPSDRRIAEGVGRIGLYGSDADDGERAACPPFTIGVIHTGLDLDASKAPADVDELLETGVDYWACGHLHRRLVRPGENDPRIVFPGCIQGRDIKESGERGCYLVKLEEGRSPQLEFVPTSSVILETVTVDVGVCQTLGDIVHLVAASLFRENGKAHCDDMVARVVLEGRSDLHRFLAKPAVVADLRKQVNDAYPSFYCDALIDRTTAASSSVVRTEGIAYLFGQVMDGIADEQRGREETMVNYVQSEFVKRGISVPASLSRRVGEFNDAAETLVSDLLHEEGE